MEMTIERFLHYWNSHDTLIIQSLVGCILLMVIYLAVRMFFGEESGSSSNESGKSVTSLSPNMTNEIEKTLQKILDNQVKVPVANAASATGAQAAFNANPIALSRANPVASGSANTEIPLLKAEIQSRDEKLKLLEIELAQAKAAPAAAMSDSDLSAKVKDLQSRLSEYEIISEDIADLSFYKEENSRMQSEITILKGGGTAKVEVPQVIAESAPAKVIAEVKPAALESAKAALVATEPAMPVETAAVDDDIMKQFAQAVEEQKAASSTADGDAPVQKAQVDTELMGKFEEFVKKN